MGISNAYLSQLETGKVQSPSPIVLHKLSELSGLPYAAVMQDAGYPLPETVKETNSATRQPPGSERRRARKKTRSSIT